MGLVNAVVTADRVLDAALDLADRIAANGPLAVARDQGARAPQRRGSHPGATAGCKSCVQSVFASDDAKEGALAFVEQRTPTWPGR